MDLQKNPLMLGLAVKRKVVPQQCLMKLLGIVMHTNIKVHILRREGIYTCVKPFKPFMMLIVLLAVTYLLFPYASTYPSSCPKLSL